MPFNQSFSPVDKAKVLIEALPYIEKFNRKIIVVKYGGSAMNDEVLKRSLIQDVVLLKLVGFKPVIVHGGGVEISHWMEKIGKKTEFVNGLRKTDEETMEIVEMVLNKVNKSLVTLIQSLNVKAVGICGKDAGMLTVKKHLSRGRDIGFVGDITAVSPGIIFDLLKADCLPVIAPIGMDEVFQSYNINADDAACAIAKAIGAYKLAFMTDVDGIYEDFNKRESFISRLTVTEAQVLIEKGLVAGGMLPKLSNCTDAVMNGVTNVHILNGKTPHCLLLEMFTKDGIGTVIYPDYPD